LVSPSATKPIRAIPGATYKGANRAIDINQFDIESISILKEAQLHPCMAAEATTV